MLFYYIVAMAYHLNVLNTILLSFSFNEKFCGKHGYFSFFYTFVFIKSSGNNSLEK